jgi:hypothetical protein
MPPLGLKPPAELERVIAEGWIKTAWKPARVTCWSGLPV